MYKIGTLVKSNVNEYFGMIGIVLESDDMITTIMINNHKSHFFNNELETLELLETINVQS